MPTSWPRRRPGCPATDDDADRVPSSPYDEAMDLLAANKLWHAWIAYPLFAGGVGLVLALVGGYIAKVVAPRYPKR